MINRYRPTARTYATRIGALTAARAALISSRPVAYWISFGEPQNGPTAQIPEYDAREALDRAILRAREALEACERQPGPDAPVIPHQSDPCWDCGEPHPAGQCPASEGAR